MEAEIVQTIGGKLIDDAYIIEFSFKVKEVRGLKENSSSMRLNLVGNA